MEQTKNMEQDEEDIETFLNGMDWDDSDLYYSDDDDIIDPNFELSTMMVDLLNQESESDTECDTAESAKSSKKSSKATSCTNY